MIGKRQGYKSPTSQPALDSAKDKAICKGGVRRTSRDHKWIVLVRCLQRSEPVCAVEHRSSRMVIDECFPPRVTQRVDFVDNLRRRLCPHRNRKAYSRSICHHFNSQIHLLRATSFILQSYLFNTASTDSSNSSRTITFPCLDYERRVATG